MKNSSRSLLGNEAGTALPVAMVALVLLMGLSIAFTSLATTDPQVARNHTMAVQARALAESGVERAIWAMVNATPGFDAYGVADSPYNGLTQLTMPTGGVFTVRIINGVDPNSEKLVTAVGWSQDGTGALATPRRIEVALTRPPLALITPPCALCVTGDLDIAGNATITSYSGSTGVAYCSSSPTSGTTSSGTTTTSGNAYDVYGPDDDQPNGPGDIVQLAVNTVPTLSTVDLDTLRSLAKANGTYYKRGVDNLTFNSSNPLPPGGGIMFIDTATGADLDPGPPWTSNTATPSSEMGTITIGGNQTWSGWIVAMGNIEVSGTVSLTGAFYARNDFSFNGNGTITGAVITGNLMKSLSSSSDVDSSDINGNSSIVYNCPAFQSGGGTVSTTWAIKPGTFRETEGRSSS